MNVKWCKRGIPVLIAVAGLFSQTNAQAQQTPLDRLKSQAPALLQAAHSEKAQTLNNAQLTQTLSMKRFAKASSSGGMQAKSLPGEAKKPENAYYFLGLTGVLMNDPQMRAKLTDGIRGALQFVQAPQQLQDLFAASQSDPGKAQAYMEQSWQWVQSRGQAATVNFFAGAWTATNLFALNQQKTFKLEAAKDLGNFYAQTGPQQAVPILGGLAGFSEKQLGPNDFQQIGGLFSQLADLLM